MKNLFAAFILAAVFAGVSFAQGKETKIAVVEFSPGANASVMNDQAKRQVQTMLAAALAKSPKLDVYDIRHTRNTSQANLASVNGASTAAAVKLGKQLNVAYVVTGTMTAYDMGGSAAARFRVVEVATGKVKHSGEFTQSATLKMTGNAGVAEIQSKVIRPLVDKMAESILGVF